MKFQTLAIIALTQLVAFTGAQAQVNDGANAGIEEIIVTAQKREQNLKDVPFDYRETIDAGHGKIEIRRYRTDGKTPVPFAASCARSNRVSWPVRTPARRSLPFPVRFACPR